MSGETECSSEQSCSCEGGGQSSKASADAKNLGGEEFAHEEDLGGEGITSQKAVGVASERDDRGERTEWSAAF